MPICPHCNESNPADVGICKNCGNSLPLVESVAEPASDFEATILGLLKGGKKIDAIKLYREKTGLGLKESKDAVEVLAAKHGIVTQGSGCAGMVLLLLLIPLVWRFLI
jgi:hypothetical protein